MHILISPNAFKNSLDATAAAAALQKGIQCSSLDCTTRCFPVGDGGDGTAALIIQQCGGEVIGIEVAGPLNERIKTQYGIIENGDTAVIEMADACGVRLLLPGQLDPLLASSYGTGEMISAALEKGVKKILIGMGGSATVDGGCGILKALGARFLDADGNSLERLPRDLPQLTTVDVTGVDPRIFNCELSVLCDVDNKLLGENGAATIFGPQKGATPASVIQLENGLTVFNEVTLKQTGKNMNEISGGGTAGGAAAGVYAYLNASLVNGIDAYLDLTNFDSALANADLVITGEGSIDEQTLQGKGPYGVAKRAKQRGIPVIGLAGRIPLLPHAGLQEYFTALLSIGQEPADLKQALASTRENLVRTGKLIGEILAIR